MSAEDLHSEKPKPNKDEEYIAANHRSLCIALAKFTRNLVAGVSENQLKALCVLFLFFTSWAFHANEVGDFSEIEPDIRGLLHYYTSWSELEGSECVYQSSKSDRLKSTDYLHSRESSSRSHTSFIKYRHLQRRPRKYGMGVLHEPSRRRSRSCVCFF